MVQPRRGCEEERKEDRSERCGAYSASSITRRHDLRHGSNVVCWSSAGSLGFKVLERNAFAAQQAAVTAANRAREAGMRSLEVNVKGPDPAAIPPYGVQTAGLEVRAIRDVTPIP